MSQRAGILHGSPWRGVFYVTGGGTLLLSELLTTAGASATVLDARVPYAAAALEEILGRAPEQACSDATPRAMAMAAFQRARHLAGCEEPRTTKAQAATTAQPLFGLACTASLASNRKKRGRHRAHVAVQTEAATYAAELTLSGAGAADREAEEQALLELLWHALGGALKLALPEPSLLSDPLIAHTPAQRHWRELILGESLAYATDEHDGRLLMPGAFNPLHHAHRDMLDLAERKTGLPGAFELSIVNVDKPLLDYTEIDTRLRQFTRPVWVTRLPTFLDKARRFPGAHFVVGVDTVARIVEPRYYGSDAARDRALAELAELGSRFVVFGRTLEGRFVTLSDLALPVGFQDHCVEVPQAEFDESVSSSALRRGR